MATNNQLLSTLINTRAVALSLGIAATLFLSQPDNAQASDRDVKKESNRPHNWAREITGTWCNDPVFDWFASRFDEAGFDLGADSGFVSSRRTYVPRVDVNESEKEVKVSAEVPGMDEGSLDVSVTSDAITIKGEKKSEIVKTEGNQSHSRALERSFGSFKRTIALDSKVDCDKAEARLKDGILTIVVPKLAESQPVARKLSIKREIF